MYKILILEETCTILSVKLSGSNIHANADSYKPICLPKRRKHYPVLHIETKGHVQLH